MGASNSRAERYWIRLQVIFERKSTIAIFTGKAQLQCRLADKDAALAVTARMHHKQCALAERQPAQ